MREQRTINVQTATRSQLIDWLCWSDINGSYTDEQCENEGIRLLTLEDARELVLLQLADSVEA